MLVIDGAQGEGGGQVLRSALGLSLATGTPFRMVNVRAGRKKPGLLRQHLTALRAAAEIGVAEVTGAELGSREVSFAPTAVRPGEYRFAVGSAGSAALVLQAVLPPLLTAAGPSTLTLEGGTHNPWAPPFPFLERTFLPQLGKMGARVKATLVRPGFYPAGGGLFQVRVEPVPRLGPLVLTEKGAAGERAAEALVARIPREIGDRELRIVRKRLGWEGEVTEVRSSAGPGNALLLTAAHEHVTEVVTGFGRRGARAEQVAEHAVKEMRAWLASPAPVGPHLADQLLLPLGLAGAGEFVTGKLTRHTRTNLEIVRAFLTKALTVSESVNGTIVVRAG